MELHDYQKKGVQLILKNKKMFLFMDVGLGKTAIAATAIEKIGHQTVVFAPPLVAETTWPDELRKWTGLSFAVLRGDQKEYKARLDKDVYLISYGLVDWFYRNLRKFSFRHKPTLVLDETSMIKDAKTKRFKMLEALWPLFGKYRMGLSATPTPNGLHELWPQAYMLDGGKHLGKFKTHFYRRYFMPPVAPHWKVHSLPDTEERVFERIADMTYRLDGRDYNKMPAITYRQIKIPMPPKVRALYSQLEKDFCVLVNDKLVKANYAGAMSSKLRQIVQGAVYETLSKEDKMKGIKPKYEMLHVAKIDRMIEMLNSSAGNPILCPIQFKFEVDMIERRLNQRVPTISGKTTTAQAKAYIRDWNNGDLPLLLCHPASIGHGLNLQAGGHVVLWMAMTWSLEQYQQLNGRLYRQGQRKGVIVNHLVIEDSIDQAVFGALSAKAKTQADFLDALRDYAKEVL